MPCQHSDCTCYLNDPYHTTGTHTRARTHTHTHTHTHMHAPLTHSHTTLLQFILQKKLGRIPPDAVYKDEEEEETGGGSDPMAEGDTMSAVLADDEMSLDSVDPAAKSPEHAPATAQALLDSERSKDTGRRTHTFSVKSRHSVTKYTHSRRQSESSVKIICKTGSDPLLKSKSLEVRLQSSRSYESDEESMYSTRPEWAFDQIAMLSDESDSEFFDAKGVCVHVCGCVCVV